MVVAFMQIMANHYFNRQIIYENNDLKQFILHILFIPSLLNPSQYSFNEPVWSVTVEVFAYFIFGFIAVTQFSLQKSIAATFLAATLSIPFNNQHVIDSRVASAIFLFFSGATIYLISKQVSTKLQMICGGASLLIWTTLFLNLFQASKIYSFLRGHEFSIVFLFGGIIFLSLLISKASPRSKLLNNRFIFGFGNLSYSIYLWHIPIQIAIMLFCLKFEINITNLANERIFFLAYIATVGLVARFSYKLIEEPLRAKLRAKS
jgi:peptidoglycan/LPS O-acetylase OafA/YrhL